jgi:hypothetical protein
VIGVADNRMRLIDELSNRLARHGVGYSFVRPRQEGGSNGTPEKSFFDFVAARHARGYTRVIT